MFKVNMSKWQNKTTVHDSLFFLRPQRLPELPRAMMDKSLLAQTENSGKLLFGSLIYACSSTVHVISNHNATRLKRNAMQNMQPLNTLLKHKSVVQNFPQP